MEIVDKIVGVKTGAQGPFQKDAPMTPIAIKALKRG
jgi:hypothetical protein